MPDIRAFPEYFISYEWNGKHALYGYPSDTFSQFEWILSLEKRFSWLRENCKSSRTSSLYLIREMIQWGGSQNGVLQKFDDRLGEVNLVLAIEGTISKINDPTQAIQSALAIPGMGLTYASKMLRFFDPNKYGALDSRVRSALTKHVSDAGIPKKIHDGNAVSMTNGYVAFVRYLESLQKALESDRVNRPPCSLPKGPGETGWRAADIEMALFCWAARDEP
ncbi:MAG: hypothetical protein V5B35_03690 [Candidatus Accumulibacter necessarius]|jgi:hypothetical protein